MPVNFRRSPPARCVHLPNKSGLTTYLMFRLRSWRLFLKRCEWNTVKWCGFYFPSPYAFVSLFLLSSFISLAFFLRILYRTPKKPPAALNSSTGYLLAKNRLSGNFQGFSKLKFYIFFLSIAYFHGQTFTVDNHRKDVASLLPATFVTASMKALNPGTWMLNCLVNDHYNAGMYALFNVTKCDGKIHPVPSVSGGKKRTYYIAANEIPWNYGPTGMNNMTGENLTLADRYERHDQISVILSSSSNAVSLMFYSRT